MAFYRGGAKWSSVFVRRAVLRASRSFARAFGSMERRCGTRHLSAIVVVCVRLFLLQSVCGTRSSRVLRFSLRYNFLRLGRDVF